LHYPCEAHRTVSLYMGGFKLCNIQNSPVLNLPLNCCVDRHVPITCPGMSQQMSMRLHCALIDVVLSSWHIVQKDDNFSLTIYFWYTYHE